MKINYSICKMKLLTQSHTYTWIHAFEKAIIFFIISKKDKKNLMEGNSMQNLSLELFTIFFLKKETKTVCKI